MTPAPGQDEIVRAAAALRRGNLVVFPTETVYGLGADATDPVAVRRLYAVKGRPATHPVIVHVGAADQVGRLALDVPRAAKVLAEACWPGPLTLVLPASPEVPTEVTGGLGTVGVRVPAQPVALALLDAFGGGVAAPSANRFGRVSPTTAADARADLGDRLGPDDVVLDGGPCRVGVESTVVDCTGDEPVVLRPGAVTSERLADLLGHDVPTRAAPGRAPGTLPSHYAPACDVRPVTGDGAEGDAVGELAALVAAHRRVGLLCPAPPPRAGDLPPGVVVLDAPRDVEEYARVLYARLREADRRGLDALVVVLPAPVGLGAAVADRIRRAAGEPVTAGARGGDDRP